jgi:hypothetical protein
LTHRNSSTNPQPLVVDTFELVNIEFEATSWVFKAGHQIRLSIAGSDWPNVWSPPGPFSLQIDRSTLELSLPHVSGSGSGTPTFVPIVSTDFVKELPTDKSVETKWIVERDILDHKTIARTQYGGPSSVRDNGTTHELYQGEVGVSLIDPSRSWVTAKTRYQLEWPEANCIVEARMRIDSDADAFNVVIDVDADLDGVEFARKRYNRRIQRRLL